MRPVMAVQPMPAAPCRFKATVVGQMMRWTVAVAVALMSVTVDGPAGLVLQGVETTALSATQEAVSQGMMSVSHDAGLLTGQSRPLSLGYLAGFNALVDSRLLILLTLVESIAGKARRRQ